VTEKQDQIACRRGGVKRVLFLVRDLYAGHVLAEHAFLGDVSVIGQIYQISERVGAFASFRERVKCD
jgi:hypothetical protein